MITILMTPAKVVTLGLLKIRYFEIKKSTRKEKHFFCYFTFFLSLFHIFLSHCLLLYYLFSNSHAQKTSRLSSISHTLYFEFLLCNVLHSVGNIYWWAFLRELFYCYSQQLVSGLANESLIPFNFIKRAPETQNL